MILTKMKLGLTVLAIMAAGGVASSTAAAGVGSARTAAAAGSGAGATGGACDTAAVGKSPAISLSSTARSLALIGRGRR